MKHEEVVEVVAEWFKSNPKVILVGKCSGDFPEPDIYAQFKDNSIGFVECKPSDVGGREYLTGFGQAIAYATLSNYSFLAIPEKEMKKYKKYFWVELIGLLAVRENGIVKVIRKAKKIELKSVHERRTRAYGYYRDLHPYEIHQILESITHSKNESSRKKEIWKTICKLRNIKSMKQRNAWILNVKLLLRDLGLVNYDLSLTEKGFYLLQVGRSRNKKLYLSELTRCFLINANYLELLALIQRLNDIYTAFSTVKKFKMLLAKEILKEKLATTQTNIMRDLQDIPRILKELGLINDWQKHGFGYRYTINWDKITKLLK